MTTAEPGTQAPEGSFSVVTRASQRRERILFIAAGVALLILVLVPLTSLDAAQSAGLPLLADRYWFRIATTILMFVIVAGAWNIIGGLTGYPAFGNVVFFGVGAYTVGTLVTKANLPYALALPAGVLVAAAGAALIGLPLLRLRGHYFAVASLGVAVATGEVINNLQFFGGASGIFMPIIRSDLLFYFLMLGGAVGTVAITWAVLHSRFGFGLIAIREDEAAAAVIGVNTTLYKVAAYMLSAALTGFAGAVYAEWNVFIDQSTAFNLDISIDSILMALIGGIGTLFGPLIGAAVLEYLIQSFAGGGSLAAYTQVGLGVLLTVAVIFLPRGIVDFFGGRSSFSLRYLRRTMRETGV
ncbi:MAG TPA: branched-chain amino acid ABC transporter permease [Candidatus Dormibacteraeota bacterium]